MINGVDRIMYIIGIGGAARLHDFFRNVRTILVIKTILGGCYAKYNAGYHIFTDRAE